MNKGLLIVVEGIDGSGKDTLRDILYDQLTKDGYKVAKAESLTDDSITGSAIRSMLNTKQETINDMRLALVYLSELVFNTDKPDGIRDMLEQGYIILCNRYHYSTKAYAGNSDNVINVIDNVKEVTPIPDIVYYIDVDVKTALSRIQGEKDFYEKESKLQHIKNNYKLMLTTNEDNNMLSIDNNKDVNIASEMIYDITINAIKTKGITNE